MTHAAISASCWLATGLVVSSGGHLLFYSSKLESGDDCHETAAAKLAPLPYHHPQLLFQALLHGHSGVVIKVLAGLATQLTEDGDVTPIRNSSSHQRITIDDFMTKSSARTSAIDASTDIFSALTAAAAKDRGGPDQGLTEEATHRLVMALKKFPLRGLSKLEHAHLSVVVQTAYEVQRQQNSLDSNGLRYLVSMRSFFIYNSISLPIASAAASSAIAPRLKFRDIAWAFHSESQDLLLDESVKACASGKLDWAGAKAMGIFMWIKSADILVSTFPLQGQKQHSS